MKKHQLAVLAALVALLISSAAFAVIVGTTETGHTAIVIERSDLPEPCICSDVFDPVVCGTFPDKKYFSNACVAACAGYTNCAGVVIQFD